MRRTFDPFRLLVVSIAGWLNGDLEPGRHASQTGVGKHHLEVGARNFRPAKWGIFNRP
jgi:hypothetical protein